MVCDDDRPNAGEEEKKVSESLVTETCKFNGQKSYPLC